MKRTSRASQIRTAIPRVGRVLPMLAMNIRIPIDACSRPSSMGLAAELHALAPAESHVVLHGSPHSYNMLLVGGEPIFIDFETACTGPAEWDLVHVEPGAEQAYGAPLRERLLWVCRAMGSVMTAAFCWADVDRGDLREHAELHLAHVKTVVVPLL